MAKQCPHCGNQEFRANQVLHCDVKVDGENEFLDDDLPAGSPPGEKSVYHSDAPFGPYQCTKCDAEFASLDELVDPDEPEEKEEPRSLLAIHHCNVLVADLNDDTIIGNDLFFGDDHEAVARAAEERAVMYAREHGCTDIDDPEVREAFLDNGYIETGNRSIMISWPDAEELESKRVKDDSVGFWQERFAQKDAELQEALGFLQDFRNNTNDDSQWPEIDELLTNNDFEVE